MISVASNKAILSEVHNIPDLLDARITRSPDKIGLVDRCGGGWQYTSWKNFGHAVELAAIELRGHGCRVGDVVAIVASTSIYWDLTQYAILKNGGIVVGIDAHDSRENINTILTTARIKGVVTDNADFLRKVDSACLDGLFFVLTFSPCSQLSAFSYLSLKRSGPTNPAPGIEGWPKSSADDWAIVVFTSGTTGKPKGIPYTHRQVLIACAAIIAAYADVAENSRLVCWLPLSNLFQRMMNYCAMVIGARTYYVLHPQEVSNYLVDISPTVFIAVPRFYEKVYQAVNEKLSKSPWLVRYSFTILHNMRARLLKSRGQGNLSGVVFSVSDWLVFNRLRKRIFGAEIKYAISGSAPMPVWLLEWFAATGLLILEAYGISENIIPVACNTPECYRFGSVGRPLSPNDVRLSDVNEVEVRGPGVFDGYLGGVPKVENVTLDGYLRTGDEGSIDAQGFITLYGRKGDFFKTSTGRRICPVAMEKALSSHPNLDHVMVVGAGRKVPIACATLASSLSVIDTVQLEQFRVEILGKISEQISAQQKPAAMLLLLQEFTVSGGELTANLKLRRRFIEEKYQSEIELCYEFLQDLSADNIHHHNSGIAITVRL